jgi:Arm DNA-binding domain
MASANITKRAVDAAKARKTDSYLWDRELPGFGLKVTPAGRKVYLVQYRLGGRKGRTRRVTIGQHGEITPSIARKEAKRLLGEIAAGRDPAAERDKARYTSLGVVLGQFMAERVRTKLKPSTAYYYKLLTDTQILPRFRRRPFVGLQRQDVARFHYDLRATPYIANRSLAVLSKLFNWAEKHGLRPVILAGMSKNTARSGASGF